MAEKRKLAFYIRLSDADEEVKAGTKDESNSITGQRKLLYAYIKKTEDHSSGKHRASRVKHWIHAVHVCRRP